MADKKSVLVPLAEGFEEIEAVTVIDVLRRAGATVTVAGVAEGPTRGSRGLVVVPDATLSAVAEKDFDMLVLPGGMPGSKNLAQSPVLAKVIERMRKSERWVAAICAAPAVVLEAGGFLGGVNATCHPGFQKDLSRFRDARVVVDGRTVTSQAPGTAMEFALELVERLYGAEKAEEVRAPMLAKRA